MTKWLYASFPGRQDLVQYFVLGRSDLSRSKSSAGQTKNTIIEAGWRPNDIICDVQSMTLPTKRNNHNHSISQQPPLAMANSRPSVAHGNTVSAPHYHTGVSLHPPVHLRMQYIRIVCSGGKWKHIMNTFTYNNQKSGGQRPNQTGGR